LKTNDEVSRRPTLVPAIDPQLQSAILDQVDWLLTHNEWMRDTKLRRSVRHPARELEAAYRRWAEAHPMQAAKAKGDNHGQKQQWLAERVGELIEFRTDQGLCRASGTDDRRTIRLLAEADPKVRAKTRAMQAAFDNRVRAGLRLLASGGQHTVAELDCVIRKQVVGPWHERASDLICRDALAAVAALTGYATEGNGKNRLIRLPETRPPAPGAPAVPPPVDRPPLTVEQTYLMNAVLLEFGYRHACAAWEDLGKSMFHYLRSVTGAAAYRHWCETHPCNVARWRYEEDLRFFALRGLIREAVRNLKRRGDVADSWTQTREPVLLTLTRSAAIVDRFCDLRRMVSLAHAAAADALARGARLTEAQLRAAMRAALPKRKGAAALDAVITYELHRLEMSGKYATEEGEGGRVFWLEDAPRPRGRRGRASAG
jgi:hypothetical protein